VQERKHADATERLFQRLVRVFPEKQVKKDVRVVGHSNTEWNVATVVQMESHGTIFEPVTTHHNSVFAVATKFHDIALMDEPLGRIAVVKNKAEMDTYLAVLAQAGNIIEDDAPNELIRELAEVA
jgi:hypothetical protein